MKKTLLYISILFTAILSAQNHTDAVRYSRQNIEGTARFMSMSGAFGALGGDLSSIQINPAGSAVFLNSYGSVTLSTTRNSNDATYFNGSVNKTLANQNFNQLGAVFVFNNNDESSSFNRMSFGIAYGQTADNKDNLLAVGRSDKSISEYFLSHAQGVPLDLLKTKSDENVRDLYKYLGETEGYSVQQAFLGYQSFIIEPKDLDDLGNTEYTSSIASGDFDQEYRLEATGLNGKFTANAAVQIDNDFFVGINLNTHFISYDRTSDFYEGNNNIGSITNEVIFINRLSVTGSGISAQIGGIAKISKMFRVGTSLELPTWYTIIERTTQRIETTSDQEGIAFVDTGVINSYPKYQLRTPAKFTGSFAVLFGQSGLISADYSYKDYSTAKFSSDNDNAFTHQNENIENFLQGSSTIRIGGEYRKEKWSFRGGFQFEESPYKNKESIGNKTGYSLGVGYNFGKFILDFAYELTKQKRIHRLYEDTSFNNAAIIDNYRNNFMLTLGLNL